MRKPSFVDKHFPRVCSLLRTWS